MVENQSNDLYPGKRNGCQIALDRNTTRHDNIATSVMKDPNPGERRSGYAHPHANQGRLYPSRCCQHHLQCSPPDERLSQQSPAGSQDICAGGCAHNTRPWQIHWCAHSAPIDGCCCSMLIWRALVIDPALLFISQAVSGGQHFLIGACRRYSGGYGSHNCALCTGCPAYPWYSPCCSPCQSAGRF